MNAPLYDASVPVFRQMLDALADLLRKGEAHARERGLDPDAMLAARLAPDMLTLVGQVQRASDHAKGAAGRLAGLEPPPFADDEQSLVGAYARISRTLDYIDTVPVRAFDRAAERIVTLPFGVPPMPAARYLYSFALPSLFFHAATAYAILRHRGVPLGKRDFLGNYLSQ
ncbi:MULTISPECIES: DUF1993 family protein [unclassified Bradyrhizobium]|uniref:DUF1993 domain-containing protein n=1 Tax=unclassified Bradyrhizobium TaxID=2631580 RepID=UPI001BAB64C6|nr:MULTISPECIES: DUF1993 domain-containing protein [unclassified Bradyrhizobium]MBR1205829.1 DUF1993 domain-containing protein [Bradyrhizobium sp. AUGA SZCCT0124]MBR1315782.1 DUF1993 domain-containing protein [Bradyrhizobium sp. AUGA SZCCT0051]MBR1338156.1 DUF1993 domain-containing protein [Bradyrhizobium sp. AUGA SZCCT0105]MBR1355811.1 DUF1993 domain-containing protein [Bradyrhizobium sp. AUGA SZCCT0045]